MVCDFVYKTKAGHRLRYEAWFPDCGTPVMYFILN